MKYWLSLGTEAGIIQTFSVDINKKNLQNWRKRLYLLLPKFKKIKKEFAKVVSKSITDEQT